MNRRGPLRPGLAAFIALTIHSGRLYRIVGSLLVALKPGRRRTTSIETLIEAAEQVEAVRRDGEGIEEIVGDKGYHSNQSLVDLEAVAVRSCISEPDRGRRNWKKNPTARDAVSVAWIGGAVVRFCERDASEAVRVLETQRTTTILEVAL